jgi:hypothetical protein
MTEDQPVSAASSPLALARPPPFSEELRGALGQDPVCPAEDQYAEDCVAIAWCNLTGSPITVNTSDTIMCR